MVPVLYKYMLHRTRYLQVSILNATRCILYTTACYNEVVQMDDIGGKINVLSIWGIKPPFQPPTRYLKGGDRSSTLTLPPMMADLVISISHTKGFLICETFPKKTFRSAKFLKLMFFPDLDSNSKLMSIPPVCTKEAK